MVAIDSRKAFKKSKDSDVRSTPIDFFDGWNKIFKFDTDVCANDDNFKCERYFTPEKDGLSQEWGNVNWCNPPYSSGQIDLWLKKGREEQIKGRTTVFLLPCDSSTRWYHDNIAANGKASIVQIKGRLKFGGSKINSPFGSSIVIFWGIEPMDKE